MIRDGKHYIGSSRDPSKRLMKHNSGCVKSTKFRKPFLLVYDESFETKELAEKRERFFKSGKGFEVRNHH